MKWDDFWQKEEKKSKNLLFIFVLTGLNILTVIIFSEKIYLTALMVSLLGILGLIKWKSFITLGVFIIGGMGGAVVEMIVISTSGAWFYSSPNILNLIPLWLFPLWANAAAMIYEIGKEIGKVNRK
jgi:hypothetical protein